jgi:hypothetical protein
MLSKKTLELAAESVSFAAYQHSNIPHDPLFRDLTAAYKELKDELKKEEKVQFMWGNPLTMKVFYIEQEVVDIIHDLATQVSKANELAKTCECETCQKIREITWQPIFG